ncbi:MAG: hypothetical protein KKH99_04235 [Proteobacteria bacterium]|nr:hypothetical protein [Pseudomonadota bacterium]
MDFDLEKIFVPSLGVDMVFDMDSLAPYSRSSIIYDIDTDTSTVTIAQPHIPFSKNTKFKDLYLTTIIKNKNRKTRVGLQCTAFRIIDHYPLANKATVPAVCFQYQLPIKETNIRSAFRLPLNTKYIIKGKILYENFEYYTSKDFSIRDISLTGLGLIVPKKKKGVINPLSQMKTNTILLIGIILIDVNQKEPAGTLPLKAQATRINTNHSDDYVLIGCKILNLESSKENILNHFIHAAQIDELKRLSGRDL